MATNTTTQEVQDDKAQHVVPFVLERLRKHKEEHPNSKPFIVGINGVQGAGKSVLVSILTEKLREHHQSTVCFSLDDFYLTHKDQEALAKTNADNPLLQHRGQPGTHDISLAVSTFKSIKDGKETKIPQYNKAAFQGQGDRVDSSEWNVVNDDPKRPLEILLFEGWCVGFRPITGEQLAKKHASAVAQLKDSPSTYHGRLGHNTLKSLTTINEALKSYDQLTDMFDAFVHIDAADPLYVYEWRLQQEEGLRKAKGSGMTDEQVENFVDGYYPAYELYTETLRRGVFEPRPEVEKEKRGDGKISEPTNVQWRGKQMRLVVDQGRKVQKVERI